jgi:hypothetical protein
MLGYQRKLIANMKRFFTGILDKPNIKGLGPRGYSMGLKHT